MTDKEIIKVLECCSKEICTECVIGICPNDITDETLNLIKKQQEEIERLEHLNGTYSLMVTELNSAFDNQRAEAIKEFAERLKNNLITEDEKKYFSTEMIDCLSITIGNIKNKMQNLIEEMLGEE